MFAYALRVMSRTPSFAVAVIGVMALSIGAQHGDLQHRQRGPAASLPLEEPERLVRLFTRTPGEGL